MSVPSDKAEILGRITSIEGVVYITNEDGQVREAKVGDVLQLKDRVNK